MGLDFESNQILLEAKASYSQIRTVGEGKVKFAADADSSSYLPAWLSPYVPDLNTILGWLGVAALCAGVPLVGGAGYVGYAYGFDVSILTTKAMDTIDQVKVSLGMA